MGKNKTPSYNAPPPPKLPTAEELYGAGTNFAKTNMPLAFGAREGGLADLARGSDYYAGFQPTSFDEALTNRYFQNVWPSTQESIKHGMSLSGLDSSPLLAKALGDARGGLEYQIGSYLSDLGNTRATNSLTARLGINPMDMVNPYVTVGMNQGNKQAELDYDYAQQLAQAEYQAAVDKYNKKNALYKTVGMFSPLGGAIYGGARGGGEGLTHSLSGTMDTLQMMMPLMTGGYSGGNSGLNNLFSSSVNPNPSGINGVNPANYVSANSYLGNRLGYDPESYFAGFGGMGGAV